MEFGLLGPLLVRIDGTTVELGAPQQRALLIHLLLHVGETVSVDRLIDALWEHDPPPQARTTLRSYVSSVRRALDVTGESLVVTRGSGYGLQVDPDTVDAVRFQRLVRSARAHLTTSEPRPALIAIDEALGLWRGEALADVAHRAFAEGERVRLEELRLSAQEVRLDALLALGRNGEAVAAAEAFTAAEPLRERAWGQLMIGLYRSGRAPDSLAAYTRFRESLIEELGLDPSPQLQHLADRILNQDPDLDLATPAVGASHTRTVVTDPESPSPLIGRPHERQELQRCVDRLVAGHGGLLLVAGEPGIGKTALLEELARVAVAAGVEVAWGRCHETRGAPAFWPWIQALGAVAAQCTNGELEAMAAGSAAPISHLVDSVAERLGHPHVVLGEDLEAARFQLYAAITAFLTAAGQRRPIVVLLDDLHWADTPSLQALAFLAGHVAQSRVAVIGTYRDVRTDWTSEVEATLASVAREPTTRQLSLTGLQPEAVGELAQQLTGKPVTVEASELLHERTSGNPFFVRQLSLLHTEVEGEHPAAGTIPTGVSHVIARRLSMLPPEVREALEAAAVIGARFDLRQLAATIHKTPDMTLEATDTAVLHGLLVAAGGSPAGYRFVHALVRETVYNGLPAHRVTKLHLQVGEALESMANPPVAQIAEHFWAAAELVLDGRAVRYLEAAAAECLNVIAYEQAEIHLRRALFLLSSRGDDPAEELRVRVRLVQLLVSVSGWGSDTVHEVAAPARELARATGWTTGMAPLWAALLSTHIARGELADADGVARELLSQAVAANEPGALVAGHSAVAYVSLTLGRDPALALEHARHAEHFAKLAAPEDLRAVPHLGAAAIYTQALALAYQDDYADAVETARRSIDVATRVADPLSRAIVHMVAGIVGVVANQPAFVVETSTAGMALCSRHGFDSVENYTVVCNSWARAQLGEDPATHADTMARGTDAIRRAGGADPMAKFLLYTAETYLLAGDVSAADKCLTEARAVAERTHEFLPRQRLLKADINSRSAAKPPH